MKRKYAVLSILLSVFLFSGLACKSKPPAKKPDVEVPEVEKPTEDELAALEQARAEAEAARLLAVDIEAADLIPEDWQKAEDRFNEAKLLELNASEDAKACREATEAYVEAKGLYEALYQKALPLFAESSRERIARLREEAIENNADTLWAKELALADAEAEEAFDLWDSAEDEEAIRAILEVRDAYYALISASKAVATKNRVDANNYADEDRDNYEAAGQELNSYAATFKMSSMRASRDHAEEALLRYRLVLNKGLAELAALKNRDVDELRLEGDKVKAPIAAKETWEAGLDAFNLGKADFNSENYDEAIVNFDEALDHFEDAIVQTAEKRVQALEAMEEADRAIEESDRKAIAAEEELGEKEELEGEDE